MQGVAEALVITIRRAGLELTAYLGASVAAASVKAPAAHGWTGPVDEAVADSYFLVYADSKSAPILQTMGHYRDEFRREAGGWRIACRTSA